MRKELGETVSVWELKNLNAKSLAKKQLNEKLDKLFLFDVGFEYWCLKI